MTTRPASPASGGGTTAAGTAARSTPMATSRGRLSVPCRRCLNTSSPARYSATPPNSAAAEKPPNALVSSAWASTPLDAKGGEHDPGDDREVPVGIGLHHQPDPGLALDLGQPLLGGQRRHVEVQPPQADGDGHAQDRPGQQRRADGLLGGAGPDGDHRLADGQDDEVPVSFGP